jgi:serine/threonine-protein kinase RsbW
VVVAAGEVPSAYPRFVDVEAEGPCVVVAEQPPALVHEPFDHNVIAGVRHSVARLCASQGLAGQRLADFVLAVNEMMTNAVRHAGGSGMLTLWCLDGALRCEIADKGPGIPPDRANGKRVPAVDALSGRGLWLAHLLCDSVTIRTGPEGTTVLLAIAVPAPAGVV